MCIQGTKNQPPEEISPDVFVYSRIRLLSDIYMSAPENYISFENLVMSPVLLTEPEWNSWVRVENSPIGVQHISTALLSDLRRNFRIWAENPPLNMERILRAPVTELGHHDLIFAAYVRSRHEQLRISNEIFWSANLGLAPRYHTLSSHIQNLKAQFPAMLSPRRCQILDEVIWLLIGVHQLFEPWLPQEQRLHQRQLLSQGQRLLASVDGDNPRSSDREPVKQDDGDEEVKIES